MGAKKPTERQSKLSIKIPLDFKNTVMAALETPPERNPKKKKRKSPPSR